MLQTGVIEPSNSPWSSPVCMVRKKDGSYRYCVDYRRMNSVTIKDASFCRLMQIILHDLLYVCCICYLDDIIVLGETPEQLMENLDRVFTRLKEKGLKAKPSKCVLFRSPIDFLSHMVSADGIQPQHDKLSHSRLADTTLSTRRARLLRPSQLLQKVCQRFRKNCRTTVQDDQKEHAIHVDR